MKIAFRHKIAATLFAGAAFASFAIAQTVPDNGAVPAAGLNLPQTLATFGKVDPNLRKPTAVVNGEIITGTDVDQRLALIILANDGKVPDEEKERLRLQVHRNLIDEALQIQEAKANKIDVSRDEVNQSYARVAQNFKRTPTELDGYLRQNGSSSRSIKRQIEGEMAWSRLLQRNVNPRINVSDEEVNAVMARLNAAKGTTEYRVGEIYLSASSENSAAVLENARKIIEQIRAGGSFAAYARQFSEATTAAVGGDLGWIKPGLLPDTLSQAVQEMKAGQIAGPIEVPGGMSILYLTDTRQVLTADPRDAVMSLRQIAISFPKELSKADAQKRATEFGQATRTMGGCGAADAIATKFGGETVDNDQLKVRDLPPALQEMLLSLQIGQATPPFGSQEEGVRVLILCGRDDPQQANGPSFDAIQSQIEEERINRRAQIYLRDLRRDAVVDYR